MHRPSWSRSSSFQRLAAAEQAALEWGSSPLSATLTSAMVGGSSAVSAAGNGFFLAPGIAVEVFRWNVGSFYPPIPTHWEQLGSNLNPAASTGQAMALGPTGLPVVAWFEATGGYVSRWDAAKGWGSLTASPMTGNFVARSLRISVGPSGTIVVGFDDQRALIHTLHVLRYNR